MTFIIAEAGINHGGNIDTAHALIDAAKDAGADAVKFQVFDAKKLEPPGERRNMLKGLQLSRDQIRTLKVHADTVGIEFTATPFDIDSLHFLVELGVQRIKIASGDIGNVPLLTAAAQTTVPVVLSTGMATTDEIRNAVDHFGVRERIEQGRGLNIVLLQCTSSYPCPPKQVNLNAMLGLQRLFGGYVGYVGLSDHTEGIAVPIAAATLGATVVEKHLTLDRNQPGPDHKASIEPNQFWVMVQYIREIEQALGDGIKRPMPSEARAIEARDVREKWREQLSSETAGTPAP